MRDRDEVATILDAVREQMTYGRGTPSWQVALNLLAELILRDDLHPADRQQVRELCDQVTRVE